MTLLAALSRERTKILKGLNATLTTYRRVAVVGMLFCLAFVVVSFSLRPQVEDTRIAVKTDRLVRTAGQSPQVH